MDIYNINTFVFRKAEDIVSTWATEFIEAGSSEIASGRWKTRCIYIGAVLVGGAVSVYAAPAVINYAATVEIGITQKIASVAAAAVNKGAAVITKVGLAKGTAAVSAAAGTEGALGGAAVAAGADFLHNNTLPKKVDPDVEDEDREKQSSHVASNATMETDTNKKSSASTLGGKHLKSFDLHLIERSIRNFVHKTLTG